MRTRTLWAALLAGEPGVIFGVSVLAFVVIVIVVLVFSEVAPRQVEVCDAGRPTVWQLLRQSPQDKEEWLQQRVEAYRNEIRAGYRSPYFLELAEAVAAGKFNPQDWLTSDLPTPDRIFPSGRLE